MNILKSFKWLVQKTGEGISWLNLFLVLLICADVFQRYIMNHSYNWIIELEWHFFGLIFLLGSPYTLLLDKHVRVDVFYSRFTLKWQSWTDLLGTLFLLLPWFILGIVTCYNYASNSFYIRESSPNPGGLPFWFVIKFVIVIGFVLLLGQAWVIVIEKLKKIIS